MKTRLLTVAFLVAIVVLLWWYHARPASQAFGRHSPSTDNANEADPQISGGRTNAGLAATTTFEPTPGGNPAAWIVKRGIQIEEDRQRGLNEWRTPIEFYGKVVEEAGMPVQRAQINFSCNDLSPSGTSNYQTTGDDNGLFSITGIKGKLLGVSVSVAGYYTSKRDTHYFYYAGENVNFVPDARNPVIFHLRKKGHAEPLIYIHSYLGGAKGYRIARDGTPLEISLVTGKTVPVGQGDFRVECWTNDQGKSPGQKYDWKCRISIPDGGILQHTDEFPFLAPLDAHQPFDEINMPASMGKDWGSNAKRNYFVKLGNGDYGRLSFEMVAGGDHFFLLESFLNPTGSRNLESDPSQLFQDLESYNGYMATRKPMAK